MKKAKKVFWGVGILIIAVVLFSISNSGASSFDAINSVKGEVDIYKSITCGCCSVYTNYFGSKTDLEVNARDVRDPSEIKRAYGVPLELESCHTTIIEDYFVEVHIPLEAIDRLIEERPDVAGIAMSGMPSGSPGMPGTKYGDFVIYAVNHDGTSYEFMRI